MSCGKQAYAGPQRKACRRQVRQRWILTEAPAAAKCSAADSTECCYDYIIWRRYAMEQGINRPNAYVRATHPLMPFIGLEPHDQPGDLNGALEEAGKAVGPLSTRAWAAQPTMACPWMT